jgi:O-methyltransferase involved in polyketide biosynthesis
MTIQAHIDEYGLTALIPFWSRVQDSISARPLLGDLTAASLAPQVADLFGRTMVSEPTCIGCCLRNLRTDQWLAELAGKGQVSTVIDLGTGLDTRLMRLPGMFPAYVEVDSGPVIGLRDRLIPGTKAIRICADAMDTSTWIGAVPERDTRAVAVVLEGVLAYQEPAAVRTFFREIRQRLPGAYVLFDSVSPLAALAANRAISPAAPHPPYKWATWSTRRLVPGSRAWRVLREAHFRDLQGDPAKPLMRMHRQVYSLPPMRNSYRLTLARLEG